MRNFLNFRRLATFLQTPLGRFGSVAASFFVFYLAFLLLYPRFGQPISVLGLIPILISAWVYGIWAGLLFTFALYAINTLIIALLGGGNVPFAILPGELLGLATAMTVSLIIGRQGELNRKSQEKIRQSTLLLEERTAHSRFLAMLNEILSAAIETDDMAVLLKMLANRTGELFGTDNCFISFWDEKLRKTIPMAAYGPRGGAYFEAVGQFERNERTLTAVVLDEGHALAIEDIRDTGLLSRKVIEKFHAGSVLGLPLIAGDRKLGAVILGFDSYHHFTKEEKDQAELAARQISLAITKTVLLEEAQQRVNELAGLHTISRIFTVRGDARQTYGLLAETLAGLLGGEMCSISLINPVTNELEPQPSAYGLEDKWQVVTHCPAGLDENGWDFSKSGIFRASCASEIPPELNPFAPSVRVDCALIAPLWDIEGRLLGVISLANKPGGFTDNDIHQLDILSTQVAAVVQNTRLLNAERTRAEQLAVLHAVATAATRSANEDQLIEQVTHIIGQRLYSDSFGILLFNEATNELIMHYSYQVGSLEGMARLPVGVGVAGSVAKTARPMRVNDVTVSEEYLPLQSMTRSELCVPLTVESKILGVVNTESRELNAFTSEDEELLSIIAGQLATAIQRLRTVQAEHYQTQQLERSNSLIRALAQVNARAAVAADPEGVLQTLGNELSKLGLRCAIALIDHSNQHAVLRYISLSDRLIRSLERISNIRMKSYTLPTSKLLAFTDCPQSACLVKDSLSTLAGWVPGLSHKYALKVLKLIGVTKTTSVCYLPLITEGKSMGVLWMWGEGIHESDMPTMSLFASQLAAALQNANLLTEVGRLAVTDDLTGLYNRRYFFEVAEKKFSHAQKNKSPLSALLVDLDHFKKFNDTYGHVVGDQVLRASAQMMASALRESDVIGRYGGEEFSIILPDTNNSAAIYVAERLLANVADVPIDTEAGKLSIQLSIGIAGISKETPTLHSLIVRADQAMYIAKSAGRNRLAVK
ncbi:MAG TPA: diguanylate cyclase [Anaerolineales bacterium]|nr:diguanylate cyclase [Anaerolineales bacterium]